ncbi:activated protein kinase kinase kinase [Seminavis robusta]|uniref:Activated protein kinase kinase kinase n=1 Tax=Seminavis robusta TaxID=568900 RepID=A0A9N8H901_9STRA|nr:activated protein kinase kinase kinase [Seminavis robusta]|eukprot:Sro104_g052710.1 activated protein kinase kinase kinase (412) ;mRNA; r:27246-28657
MVFLLRGNKSATQESCKDMNVAAIEAEVEYYVHRSPFLMASEETAQHVGVSAGGSLAPATFDLPEIQIGKLLGEGGFSKVLEINGFELQKATTTTNSSSKWTGNNNSADAWDMSAWDMSALPMAVTTQDQAEKSRTKLSESARDSRGNSRYAIKFVKDELAKKSSHEYRTACCDIVVESKYLRALDHPNILKLRGLSKASCAGFANGPEGFFVIVDRLQETMLDRINRWKEGEVADDVLILKADYALQVADALAYLHDRRILFRDLKPGNCGFHTNDVHTVQLFDFGLCRELPESATEYEDDESAFQMSGAGTFAYMAPEIVNKRGYNLKADVYSWAFLFYEMISLQQPFEEYSIEEHREFVCQIGQRPNLTKCDIPKALQSLLRKAWEHDPSLRLSMRQAWQQLQRIAGT